MTGALVADAAMRAWNDCLAERGGHLLQSWQWGAFKERHGWSPERVTVDVPGGSGMAQVLFRHRGPVSIGYIPRGPRLIGDATAVWPALRDRLDEVAGDHRAISVILEPDSPLGLGGRSKEHGLVGGPTHFQPARTVKVPLVEDDALLQQMHQKTRYSVRLAQRRGVVVDRHPPDSAAVDTFYRLLADTAKRNDFSIHSWSYYADFLALFGDHAVLLFARVEGQVAAAVIAARFGSEATYMYGASSTEHRSDGSTFLLQYEVMRWARDHGCAAYDLWGIPEQDPTSTRGRGDDRAPGTKGEDWRGLYRFKTGFGGDIITYPPTLERRYQPLLAWLARRATVIRG